MSPACEPVRERSRDDQKASDHNEWDHNDPGAEPGQHPGHRHQRGGSVDDHALMDGSVEAVRPARVEKGDSRQEHQHNGRTKNDERGNPSGIVAAGSHWRRPPGDGGPCPWRCMRHHAWV